MNFRRIDGALVSPSGRYRVEREDYTTDCEHPSCWALHKKFREGDTHLVTITNWIVWDTVSNDYPEEQDRDHETQRQARARAEELESSLAPRPTREPRR